MYKGISRFCIMMMLAALAVGFSGSSAMALEEKVLRTGTVVSTSVSGLFNYTLAKDESGKEFWFITDVCPIEKGAMVEVLSGEHFDKVQAKQLGKTLEDVYAVGEMSINGKKQPGLIAHGLPGECEEIH